MDRPPRAPQSEAERIFEMSPALLAVAGFDGYLRRFNPAFAVFGYSRDELLSRPWIEFAHPDDRPRMEEAAGALAEGAQVMELENRVVCRDGSFRWVKWSTRVVPEEGLFYAAGRDVTESRQAAEEQAALRRVATVVARGSTPEAVFEAVGREVGQVLAVEATHLGRFEGDHTVVSVAQWGRYAGVPLGARFSVEGDSVSARVLQSGRAARMDGYEQAPGEIAAAVRDLGIRFSIGVPISVDGRLWGVMIATSKGPRPFPAETETRLEAFTELVATAVSNVNAHAAVQALADEQAGLRRVATLVAQGAAPETLYWTVVDEVGTLLGVDAANLARNIDDVAMTPLAMWAADGDHPAMPGRVPIESGSLGSRIVRTGAAARTDDWSAVEGAAAALLRDQLGVRSSVVAPIKVADELWGAIAVHSKSHLLPPETEARLERFATLVSIALTNAQARSEVQGLADEQAALRRVATVVARQAPQGEVFAAVAEEIGRLLGVESIQMIRYDLDRLRVCVASAGPITRFIPVGTRAPVEGNNVSSLVFRTGRPARIDDQAQWSGPLADRIAAAEVRSIVGTPIHVEGRLWGTMMAFSHDARLGPDTEARIAQFTELMATAIANAEARSEVARLADEQAALRRVATLVAVGASPAAVFEAATREVAGLLGASAVSLARYEDEMLTVVAQQGTPYVRVGDRYPVGGDNVTTDVLRTGRTARRDDNTDASGAIGEVARRSDVRSVVASPIVVDGRTWGMLAALWGGDGEAPPADTEDRMARFAQLLDTAIANADSRDQLTASRARVLAAGDDARRRVVRDLHDGVQQRLVHAVMTLRLAQRSLAEGPDQVQEYLAQALETAERGMTELRELSHGILPTVLTVGGLHAAVDSFVSRLDVIVDVDVSRERLPPDIEASAYFIVAEALTNVVKHARAGEAAVRAVVEGDALTVEVRDDGIGGADPEGHGLIGIADRVEALGGSLRIQSPAGGGTVLTATLPLWAWRPDA